MSQSEYRLPKVFEIFLKLAPYPILADPLRERMREEIFKRDVIPKEVFEQEVEDKAIQSQQREGLQDPFGQESEQVWEQRKRAIADHLTDFYFAYNLPSWLLDDLIIGELGGVDAIAHSRDLTFNPELALLDLLFAKGRQYETLPPEERSQVQHHLQEIKVVLIKAMISYGSSASPVSF